jgi:hypothetical protein
MVPARQGIEQWRLRCDYVPESEKMQLDESDHLRLVTHVKLLLKQLHETNLHFDVGICTILRSGEHGTQKDTEDSPHLDSLHDLSLDCDGQVFARLRRVWGDFNGLNLDGPFGVTCNQALSRTLTT